MFMRQWSNKTAKYKISYRDCPTVFSNGLTSTLQSILYMAPDQTQTNVSNSTPDQEIPTERPYSRQITCNKKETVTNKDFDQGFWLRTGTNECGRVKLVLRVPKPPPLIINVKAEQKHTIQINIDERFSLYPFSSFRGDLWRRRWTPSDDKITHCLLGQVTEKVKSSHIYKYPKPVNPWKINCKACVANWTLFPPLQMISILLFILSISTNPTNFHVSPDCDDKVILNGHFINY